MSTQSKVLSMLLAQKAGTPISGETMAQELALSRTAIWKAINELKKTGHQITSLPNQGYVYRASDILSVEDIQHRLKNKQLPLNIFVYEELASTNQTLKKMAIDGQPSPTLVIADTQTKTKGRFGRGYFAAANGQGIYFSLLLNPQKKFADVTQYTLITAVAMARTVEAFTPAAVTIKWVNDIYLAGRKVAGILSEAITDFETQTISSVIIGIGTNFAIPTADFPPDLQGRATSIFPEGQPTDSRSAFIATFIDHFFALLDAPSSDYIEEYRQRSFVLGRNVSFTQQQKQHHGTAIGISDTGELLVKLTTGEEVALSSGEISLERY